MRPFGLPRATFTATTQHPAFCRDWRSVGDPDWPKWAWHSRWVHILKTSFFTEFKNKTRSVVLSVPLGGPGPLRAPSGGALGAHQPAQGPGHFEAVFPSCLLSPAGSRGSPRARTTTKLRVLKNPRKTHGLGVVWHPRESNTLRKCRFLCFYSRRGISQKGTPKGRRAKPSQNR